ncbi:GerMN domain-containing protein [Leptospira sp. GIMC2001]|uniref:GerMN domain-containing protein n=1 Tax=Leptospira sp. GIMC2001 TaxID=1513297 RepID=UPI00234A4FE6|nr:GerMN domain-containing protein [Leptospira sp. GIMC2001]WCL47950.1 GerMN domain-containing protein [Leptospira sp. GIMC2001]
MTPKIQHLDPSQVVNQAQDNFSLGKDWTKGFSEFRNLGKSKNTLDEIPNQEIPKPIPIEETDYKPIWDDEDVAVKELNALVEEDEIPVIDDSSAVASSHVNIYFIKFFGSDNKAESRLVKVPRKLPKGADPIEFTLSELKKGPSAEEKEKGVLNALPTNFSYAKSYKLENGILKIDLGGSFEYGAGPEILKDRMDQIAFSLIGISSIRGIQFTLDQKKVTSLGGDGIPVPIVLSKRDRRVTTL